MKLLVSTKDSLHLAVAKASFLISTCIALFAGIMFWGARGDPPGIIFVPVVVAIWLIILAVTAFFFFSMKYAVRRFGGGRDTGVQYTYSILVATAICFYFFLYSVYSLLPNAAPVMRGGLLIHVLAGVACYLCMAGTVLQRKWARYTTIILMLPFVLFFLALLWQFVQTGVLAKQFSFNAVLMMAISSASVWILYDYVRNKKVLNYFHSGGRDDRSLG